MSISRLPAPLRLSPKSGGEKELSSCLLPGPGVPERCCAILAEEGERPLPPSPHLVSLISCSKGVF